MTREEKLNWLIITVVVAVCAALDFIDFLIEVCE